MVNVQNHKLILSLLLCAVTGIFTACTDETEHLGQRGGTPLSIQVGVNTTQSRAIVTGNSLADGSQIGVAVVDGTGTGYQDQVYNNICYTGQTVDGVQQWVSTDNILLSGEEGTLYAYHPWSSSVTDLSSIAVNMDETDQKDWMVAAPVTDLSDAQSTAAVKMDHVLSNFKLAFYKGNYSGKGVVSAVKVRSNAFAVTGTLDAIAGGFTAYGSTHELSRDFSTTLGTDKTTAEACDVMVVPNNEAGSVTVSVTVDGMTYSSVTTALTLEKGISYNYIMQLTSSGLQITEVTLTDWQTTELGETEFTPEGSSNNAEKLSLAVEIPDKGSRSVITGNVLPDNSQIGVAVVDKSGISYMDKTYKNICYTGKTVDGVQVWTADDDILLNGEEGTLYAYHPWSASVTDLSSVAVNMDETDQKDWMVATPVTGLSETQSIATVKLKHVLCNLSISFNRRGYTGQGLVSAVKVQSDAFAVTGTLNALTGVFTAYGSTHEITREFSTNFGPEDESPETCNVMVIPNGISGPVTVSVTVDDVTYTFTTSAITFGAGQSYRFNMNMTKDGLVFSSIVVYEWNVTLNR